MGKYKGKYLKENTAAVRSAAQYDAGIQSRGAQQAARVPDAKSSAPSRQKKSKWFPICLALYVVILLGVSGYLQITLWRYLESSQAEMDRQAAELAAQQAYEKAVHQAPQLVFDEWQSNLTTDYWTDLWYAQAPSDLDVRELVYDYMAERFAPEAIEAFKAAEFTDETPVYVLKNGADSLARITLAGSELDWSVSEVELLIEGSYSASVTVAEGYQVRCNGKEMDQTYAEEVASALHVESLTDLLEEPVTWSCYSVQGLLMEPELTVEPPAGYTALQNEAGYYLLCPEKNLREYTDKAVSFVKAYLYYYMSGFKNTESNMYGVLKYLTPGTQAYRDIRETYSGVSWATNYSGIDTSKTYAGDVIVWAENCFSVDVTYDADATLSRQEVDYADATMRVYFLRTDKGVIISNFETL